MQQPAAPDDCGAPARRDLHLEATRKTPLPRGFTAVALFLFALLLRLHFSSGFVLGDDVEEWALIQRLLVEGVSFEGHLAYRVPMWLFNVAGMSWLGVHEAVFFLPTWLLSSLLPVLAYATLRALDDTEAQAGFAGLFVALSPFEVLIGSVRANDLFLTFFLALAFYLAVRLPNRPVAQGLGVAAALWAGFYAKLWLVFAYPVTGLYFLSQALRRGDPRGLVAFVGGCLLLHLGASAYWRWDLGLWLPFVESTSATYPVPPERLLATLLEYPRLILFGSAERGHTLFGAVPYLLAGALALRIALPALPPVRRRSGVPWLDGTDVWLLAGYGSFFLLLNFFPNSFVFDQYYSAPRIFRYLSPLSFFFSLHVAKLLVDLGQLTRLPALPRRLCALGALAVLAAGASAALAPAQDHRRATTEVRARLRASCPPAVVMESWQARFFRGVHLRHTCPDTWVVTKDTIYDAREYERWLRSVQQALPRGAVLVTGLPAFVHYSCLSCGLRLGGFEAALHPSWELTEELSPVSFDGDAEPVRLWKLRERIAPRASPRLAVGSTLSDRELFEQGIAHFDAHEYPETRASMRALLRRAPSSKVAAEAAYFEAVSFWREGDLYRTVERFRALLQRYPRSTWVGPAQYHIGLAHVAAGVAERARPWLERAAASGPSPVDGYAVAELERLDFEAPFAALGRLLTELVYRFQALTHPQWEEGRR